LSLRRAAIATIVLAGAIMTLRPAIAVDLTVFAAASTAAAMREAASVWKDAAGNTARIVYASSGALARQIDAGAPADLFLSANETWVDWLDEKGALAPGSRKTIFGNALVLAAPAASIVTAEIDPATGTYAALSGNNRLAMGDPRHVPAGIYARQALQSLGLWDTTEPRTARMPDVRQALALVERGEAVLGIVYRSDVFRNSQVRTVLAFAPTLHDPIRYVAAAVKNAPPAAAAFLAFLQGPAAQAVFTRQGFTAGE
jgi:molybdate transport system substrate-binding protein